MGNIFQILDKDRKCVSNIRVDKIQCLEYNPDDRNYNATLVSGIVYKNISHEIFYLFSEHCKERLINVNDLIFVDAKRIQTLSCLDPDPSKHISDYQVEMMLVSGWTIKVSLGLSKDHFLFIEQIWRRTI